MSSMFGVDMLTGIKVCNIFIQYKLYIFYSDLARGMQLMIIKIKNSCCVYREFLTFNAH